MYKKFSKNTHITLIICILLFTLTFGQVVLSAQKSNLVSLLRPLTVVVNSSFISPLVELFGDISVGQKVFIASNTVLRADPDTRIHLK